MPAKSRRVVGKKNGCKGGSSRLGWAGGPQDGYQTQNVTHPCAVYMQATSKIGGRAALRSSRLLGGRGVDDRVVELYAGLKAGLQGRRIGCGAPQGHLGRELRFNSESEILLNTSESSLEILTLASYVQRDPYIDSASPGLKMSQCSPECHDIGYHEPRPRANASLPPQVRSG